LYNRYFSAADFTVVFSGEAADSIREIFEFRHTERPGYPCQRRGQGEGIGAVNPEENSFSLYPARWLSASLCGMRITKYAFPL